MLKNIQQNISNSKFSKTSENFKKTIRKQSETISKTSANISKFVRISRIPGTCSDFCVEPVVEICKTHVHSTGYILVVLTVGTPITWESLFVGLLKIYNTTI